MVEPNFQDLPIECFWSTKKLVSTPQALCLFHSNKEHGQPLIAALAELEAEGCPSKRAVTFRPCERKQPFRALKLRFVEEIAELRIMHISHAGNSALIEMTPLGLPVIREAIQDWLRGSEDFGVNPTHARITSRKLGVRDRESAALWFWGPNYLTN